ncbi:hypothetical protein ABH922_001508 [Rhodococcus sp. 27YEA15]|uniref:hypothetical protein n=1 Tax=Rhodococcus sp. 27YEA15 TaxID=3156259 RepID=UPI003C7DD0C6
MTRIAVRTAVLAGITTPLLFLAPALASAETTFAVTANNTDRTVTVTPTEDENGLKECEFKLRNAADKTVEEKKVKYVKDGIAVGALTFAPVAYGEYTVKIECEPVVGKSKIKLTTASVSIVEAPVTTPPVTTPPVTTPPVTTPPVTTPPVTPGNPGTGSADIGNFFKSIFGKVTQLSQS